MSSYQYGNLYDESSKLLHPSLFVVDDWTWKNHAQTQSLFQVPSRKQNTGEAHMDNNCNGSLCYVAHCSYIKLPVH